MIYKFLTSEASIGTASSVGGKPLVRLVNTTTAPVVITVANTAPATIATFTLLANSEVVVEKSASDTVQGTGILATAVAFRSGS